MSVEVMGAVWNLDLPQNLKLVLLAFADHADDEGICYPSVARIAWKSGYSERQVKAIGKELRAAGLMELVRNADGGRGKTAVYRIRPEKGARLSPFPGKGEAGNTVSRTKGCDPAQERVKPSAQKGEVASAPQPSRTINEPSEKPFCAERSKPDHSALLVSPPVPAPVIELPLNDGSQYAVLPNAVAEWKHLMEALEFLEMLRKDGIRADLAIFDPPYSLEQCARSYKNIGRTVTERDTQIFGRWTDHKHCLSQILTDDATVLSFGWNTQGIGKKHGFEIVEIGLVCHGAAHNDTICMAERRIQPCLDFSVEGMKDFS